MTDTTRPPTQRKEAPRERILFYDNLRVVLTVLVILHHVAVTYGNIPVWFYTEPAQDPSGGLLDLLVVFNQAFFMGFFFLISGCFVPGAHDRKGGRRFLTDRLLRLGVPLVLFLVVLRPALTFGSYTAMADDLPYWMFYLVTWDPGPMWFVEVLLVFSAVYVLWRRFADRRGAPASPAAPAPAPGRAPGPLAVIGFTLALAAATYLWNIVVLPGSYWPLVGLPSPSYLPQYVALFAVGILGFRRGWFQSLPRSAGWAGFAVAAVGALAFLPLLGVLGDEAMTGGGTWQSLVSSLWGAAFAVGVILALLVLFRERFDRQGRLGRLLSGNAYAVYVLHPLVLVALGHSFAWLEAPAVVKFAIVAALAVPLCWALAALVRSVPGVRRIL
ncbi:acyltransferase family protein [Actinorugispora endophytica]|uniref:Fucose 4-O-acetylase-like acetyltransferase n=1 Tax=Actinorugispora endophytica TaxID=1605990 RepID=A0A4R6UJQ7_9ACTN|nr:acyltransferase [Actinorugispora endophytica]TDQ47190.1 fucose 4-O-acetylase-like acetyltransferase [Actinorugispora endophytica]